MKTEPEFKGFVLTITPVDDLTYLVEIKEVKEGRVKIILAFETKNINIQMRAKFSAHIELLLEMYRGSKEYQSWLK